MTLHPPYFFQSSIWTEQLFLLSEPCSHLCLLHIARERCYHKPSSLKPHALCLSCCVSAVRAQFSGALRLESRRVLKVPSGCQPGAVVSLRLDWGRLYSQARVAAGSIPFPAECQSGSLSFLLAVNPRLPSAPCLMAPSRWWFTGPSSKPGQEWVSSSKTGVSIWYNIITHTHTQHTHTHIHHPQRLLVKRKSQIPSALKRRDLHDGVTVSGPP